MFDQKHIDVAVFGSAIIDFICYVDRLPKTGETLHGHKFCNGFGGKGANQCVAARRLGAKTAMIAKLGSDIWGKQYIEKLKHENIDVNFVKQCENENTGIAQIAVSNQGENHIIIVAGANNTLSEKDVIDAMSVLANAKVLLCQLETPVEGNLAALNAFKGISILNAAPALKDIPVELLKAASILCVNETEAALMCQIDVIKSLDYVDRLPKTGETLHGHKFCNGFGGKGANQCVAARRLGAKTAMIAKLGSDIWGKQYIEKLKHENIDVNFVKQCENENTGIAQIAVSNQGENHIIIVAGANNTLSEKDVIDAMSVLANAKVLLCQLETPVEGNLAALNAFKGISILNAAPALKDIPVELLKAASILCVNETEAALMCQIDVIKSLE